MRVPKSAPSTRRNILTDNFVTSFVYRWRNDLAFRAKHTGKVNVTLLILGLSTAVGAVVFYPMRHTREYRPFPILSSDYLQGSNKLSLAVNCRRVSNCNRSVSSGLFSS